MKTCWLNTNVIKTLQIQFTLKRMKQMSSNEILCLVNYTLRIFDSVYFIRNKLKFENPAISLRCILWIRCLRNLKNETLKAIVMLFRNKRMGDCVSKTSVYLCHLLNKICVCNNIAREWTAKNAVNLPQM